MLRHTCTSILARFSPQNHVFEGLHLSMQRVEWRADVETWGPLDELEGPGRSLAAVTEIAETLARPEHWEVVDLLLEIAVV